MPASALIRAIRSHTAQALQGWLVAGLVDFWGIVENKNGLVVMRDTKSLEDANTRYKWNSFILRGYSKPTSQGMVQSPRSFTMKNACFRMVSCTKVRCLPLRNVVYEQRTYKELHGAP